MTTFELNGGPIEASAGHPHLLAALRDDRSHRDGRLLPRDAGVARDLEASRQLVVPIEGADRLNAVMDGPADGDLDARLVRVEREDAVDVPGG